MMFLSGLSITSYIFDWSENLISVTKYIQLCFIIWVLNLQQLFRIKSTLFTIFSCMKLILTYYRYIWCFIVYTSYGCFFEGHLRWFNRWLMCSLFHNVYNLESQGTSLEGVQVKKFGAQIKVKDGAMCQGEGNGLPMLAGAWQKSEYWDTREDSPTLCVVVDILKY